jgi:hypothetical protein
MKNLLTTYVIRLWSSDDEIDRALLRTVKTSSYEVETPEEIKALATLTLGNSCQEGRMVEVMEVISTFNL